MKKLTKLESLRGFASVYVALGHFFLQLHHIPSAVNYFFKFGQEAVIIFFILSGFVIFYSYEKSKDKSLIIYFIKRFRRIYFPFICAILVSIVLVSHSFYVKDLVGNLLMLQDFGTAKPGNLVNSFLGNLPLWSLSYEWVFYLLFPFIFPVIKNYSSRVHFVGTFSLINLIVYILFPNHIALVFAYFLIWWTGLELGNYFLGNSNKTHIRNLVFYYLLIILVLIINCFIYHKSVKHIEPGIYPYILLRHYGFAFICLFCTVYLNSLAQKFISLLKPFSWIAPISYSIYILHYPILVQTHFNIPIYIELPVKFILLFGLAYLIEIILQPIVNRYISGDLFFNFRNTYFLKKVQPVILDRSNKDEK
jgi:peptidoglycan/LPS O-acetylase OafA/YrhL